MTELSPRQEEILELIKEGKSNNEMAVLLGISVRTVEMHRARTLKKLGVSSALALKEQLERSL